MSVNSSSCPNASLTLPPFSSSINIYDKLFSCFDSTVGALNITAFTIISILLLLPLCALVLYLGLQRWRQQRSNTTTSPADIFTYHMAAAEVISVLGVTLISCGVHADFTLMAMVGIYCFSIKLSGQIFFHILTCVERYLAVVHPITYMSLKKAKGIKMRNITIGCAWLLSFTWMATIRMGNLISTVTITLYAMSLAMIVVSLCSLSVLRVLIRPGPGEGGGDRQQVDQSKLRAFYTIMIILGVLLFRFGGNILIASVYAALIVGGTEMCGMLLSITWLSLPSSLVLPLLFLQRAGKLVCCKKKNKSRPGSD